MMKKKKNARERRVLVGAVVVAGVMVAGSTFAWFTSQDEVTNRLSASAEYSVAVAESFQPPENWVPGQEINKDAGAVNTGNVDAFVRMWLTGSMRLLQQSKSAANTNAKAYGASAVNVTGLTDVKDANLLNASLTKMDTNGNYFKTLEKNQTINPGASVGTNNSGYAHNESLDNTATGPYSEVQAMQSGILAYAPSGAKYSYVLDQETELEVYLTSTVDGEASPSTGYRKVQVPAGTLVIAGGTAKASALDANGVLVPNTDSVTITSTSGSTHAYTSVVYIKSQTHDDSATFFVPQNIEMESFTPMTDGLYLFLRNENSTDQADPEFSGYYVDGVDGTSETPATGTYYALNTGIGTPTKAYRSDYTVKGAETAAYNAPIKVTYDNGTGTTKKNIIQVVPTENLELFTAQYANVAADELYFYADDAASSAQKLYAIYDKEKDGDFDADDDIIVEIDLANIGTDAQQWTGIGATALASAYTLKAAAGSDPAVTIANDASKLTFYYNDDLEAGDTSAKLVDKVKLYEGVTNKAYLAFDFDLNVHLESIQVTMDDNGNEAATAVASGWAATQESGSDVNTGATGTQTPPTPSGEITSMAWAKYPTT